MVIDFNAIMAMRATAMAEKGMKPEGSGSHPTGPPQDALKRRVSGGVPGVPLPSEEPAPSQFMQKLPPEIAALAAKYGRL